MANGKTEVTEAEGSEETPAGGVAVAGKVTLETWQKVKYLSLKRSMATGQNITMSKCVGELLDKVAETLESPPSDLVGQ